MCTYVVLPNTGATHTRYIEFLCCMYSDPLGRRHLYCAKCGQSIDKIIQRRHTETSCDIAGKCVLVLYTYLYVGVQCVYLYHAFEDLGVLALNLQLILLQQTARKMSSDAENALRDGTMNDWLYVNITLVPPSRTNVHIHTKNASPQVSIRLPS